MANTLTATTLVNGPRNLVRTLYLKSDGSTGNVTNGTLIDRSAFTSLVGTETVILKVWGALTGFSTQLIFDATADVPFLEIPAEQPFCFDFSCFGGVSSNKAGSGATGDILYTTAGFASATDQGNIFVQVKLA